MRIIRGFVKYFFKAYFNLFLKIERFGMENIPKEGGYVICSNHIHWQDPIMYVAENKRMIYAIAKEELFSTRLKAFVMNRLGLIKVERDGTSSNKDSLNKAVQKLKEGELLLIYPEGTRFGLAKGLKPKKGVAFIALEARVPIIPMAIVGSFKPFTKLRIKVGEPMDISSYYPNEGEKVNPRNLVKLTNEVMDNIIKLRDSIQTPEIEKQMLESEEKREKKLEKKNKTKEIKNIDS